MKKLIVAMVLGLVASTAMAASTVNFTLDTSTNPATYTTDTGDVITQASVGIGSQPGYRLTLNLDGNVYQGYVASSLVQQGFGIYTASAVTLGGLTWSGITWQPNGSYVVATFNWTVRHACVRSGRGQHCTDYYTVVSGQVTTP